MEKDNIKENEIESKVKEEVTIEESNTESKEEEILVNESKPSFFKTISANFLDQLLIVASSSVLILIFDFILKMFGYRIVRDNGILILVAAGVYFIINCIYEPLMKKTKLKNTIARRILHI